MAVLKLKARGLGSTPALDNDTWGANAVKDAALTDAQKRDLADRVLATGKERKKAQGVINEADFIAGALSVYHALNIPCPAFIIAPLCGRKLFDEGEEG